MDVNVYGTAKVYWGTMGRQSHLQEPRDPGEDTGTEGNQENPGSPRPKEMGCQAGKRNRVHGSQKKKIVTLVRGLSILEKEVRRGRGPRKRVTEGRENQAGSLQNLQVSLSMRDE